MKSPFIKSATIVLFTTLALYSCRREREDLDFSASRDNALAETYFNELKNIADEAYSGNMLVYRSPQDTLVYGCATVIRDTSSNPKTITVDFGPVNCQCNDTKYRRGKVVFTYNGAYRDPGTVITHTPQNYFVNDNQLTGSKTVTNMGRNAANNLWYQISVNGSVIKANNGGTITWVSNRQREWIAGESTVLNWLDDVYLITGNANGTAANGESFVATILSPLRKEMSCYHFVSGSLKVEPSNHAERVVDWGSGNCDNTATVTVNGNTYTISL